MINHPNRRKTEPADALARLKASKTEHEANERATDLAAEAAREEAHEKAREAGRQWARNTATYGELLEVVDAAIVFRLHHIDRPEGNHDFRSFQAGAKEIFANL